MSAIYVLEPPTKGKVILNTTHGPIDIELWPKEAPKAVRNFVQLCLEGYYDNTIFHRIIKGFLIQGGDPTGTGTGGESIYGDVFGDEFHSRLRFNHRGIVACANAGSPHSNGSQFFISLDKCDWLDRKSTIFGKVTGDSIYNLLALGDVETDKNDWPLDPPPKIKSVEVLWNPFEDIVPRGPSKSLIQSATDAENRDSKKKPVKKLNLLSFGEEAEEEEKELAAVKQKIKSSHDVLDDPRLLKEEHPSKELDSAEAKAKKDLQLSVREALSSKKYVLQKDSDAEISNSDDDDDDEANFDARMRQQILRKRLDHGNLPSKDKKNGNRPENRQISAPGSTAESIDDDQPRVEKLSMKKKGIGSEARAERMANANVDLQLFSEAERGRLLKKQKKRRLQGREDEVLAKLEKFKKAISKRADAPSTESGGTYKEDLSDWASMSLAFAPEPGKDRMSRREDPNDYVVHDPLLEKGKEKFNRMQAKQKRREREWAGKSLT
ncbi:peptidyl-prolyl cis-trans isomerase CYP57 isoform X2 [Ricinus communis]|uniref:Peptidyl-prolyl cis-trans isomerase, putative n=1 Tax=Ricinus communis TaxID=3988 RepID=B9RQS7_RICCO|nr:peptidyl-prolyl cis-trans isomerase CYP57 isoform X2 [Ricinus communis]EEF46098.1 peptidyl-prolyl cis-trans isomerase, putative [Ricinus communis]|eukprot:XP_002516096.1 peptidyl-prolyl cis-trans isomerase CYP57 [Ricinus communis]